MNQIKDVKILPMKDSNYIFPFRMEFKENGVSKLWDLVQVHSSVTIIVYNVTRQVLVCVRQFRPSVYINKIPECDRKEINIEKYPRESGLILEWCAGIIDKDKSLEEIACDEIIEECGYRVKPEMLERVQSFRCSVGIAGDEMTMFYVQVTDEMKVSHGGGLPEEGEFIEVVELSLAEASDLLNAPVVSSPSDFLYGLMWFFVYKVQKLSLKPV